MFFCIQIFFFLPQIGIILISVKSVVHPAGQPSCMATTVVIGMKFRMLPQPLGLVKLRLNLFGTSNIQGRELC